MNEPDKNLDIALQSDRLLSDTNTLRTSAYVPFYINTGCSQRLCELSGQFPRTVFFSCRPWKKLNGLRDHMWKEGKHHY